METFVQVAQGTGIVVGYAVAVALCAGGVALSTLSLSGTWLVVGAAVLCAFLSGARFPRAGTVVAFIVVSAGVEVVEALAGAWGVKRRGGSGFAGFMALVGGIAGAILGTAIPIPIVGTLVGMLAGSFGCVFAVERYRLAHNGRAAHIAMGAVLARVLVVFLKVSVTLGMILVLAVGMAIW